MTAARLTMALCEALTKQNIRKFLDSFDNILADCDGVIWHGNTPIKGSVEVVNHLQKIGKKVFFVTNNSSLTRLEYSKKFTSLGFEVESDQIFCASTAVANYLKSINFNKKAYVIGSSGTSGELDAVGIQHIGLGPDPITTGLVEWLRSGVELDSDVAAVIVSFDPHFNFMKLLKAASYLKKPDCIFVATNLDPQFPIVNSSIVVPGTGSLVEAVRVASARNPVVLGKPEKGFFNTIVYQHGIDPTRTIMIGDRIDTDIMFGSVCGLQTLLVLTGISTLQDVDKHKSLDTDFDKKLVPNFYIQSLGEILDLLKDSEKE